MMFEEKISEFWREFGDHRLMVLSASLDDIVTSRMMSVVAIDRNLYFQTDTQSGKYAQLKGNPHAALCIDNIQMQGICTETGHPAEDPAFCALYEKSYPGSFKRYTNLKSERLFRFEPSFIERWVYLEGEPYVETMDISRQIYNLRKYAID